MPSDPSILLGAGTVVAALAFLTWFRFSQPPLTEHTDNKKLQCEFARKPVGSVTQSCSAPPQEEGASADSDDKGEPVGEPGRWKGVKRIRSDGTVEITVQEIMPKYRNDNEFLLQAKIDDVEPGSKITLIIDPVPIINGGSERPPKWGSLQINATAKVRGTFASDRRIGIVAYQDYEHDERPLVSEYNSARNINRRVDDVGIAGTALHDYSKPLVVDVMVESLGKDLGGLGGQLSGSVDVDILAQNDLKMVAANIQNAQKKGSNLIGVSALGVD